MIVIKVSKTRVMASTKLKKLNGAKKVLFRVRAY